MKLVSAIARVQKSLEKFSSTGLERASLLTILLALGGLMILFGFLFWRLTPSGNGIHSVEALPSPAVSPGASSARAASFGESLYFSVVTISSLGYGDLSPIGWGRVLAAVEVMLGLAIMGIFVAKLSSARLSFLVRRLYATDAQGRLNRISAEFEGMDTEFKEVIALSSQAFAEIPMMSAEQKAEKLTLAFTTAKRFERLLGTFRNASISIRDYLSFEIAHGAFFDDAPMEPVQRTGETAGQIVFLLAQLIIGLPASGRADFFQPPIRTRLNEALNSNKEICRIVLDHCQKEDVRKVFEELQISCDRVPEALFNVPVIAIQQPDQILPSAGEPQTG